MDSRDILSNIIENTIAGINATIDCLYITSEPCTKNRLLNCLRKDMAVLTTYIESAQSGISPGERSRGAGTFTAAELAAYNGKNGNPAYVAVNGTVYDVTNTAQWGGATHFGLTPGKDLTAQFSSCHAGQPVLGKLKIVGKMVQ